MKKGSVPETVNHLIVISQSFADKNNTKKMDKLEKLIYSVKHLPAFLYFGSVALIGYNIYCNIIIEAEFLNEYTETPLYIVFFYMTYLGVKNLKKK